MTSNKENNAANESEANVGKLSTTSEYRFWVRFAAIAATTVALLLVVFKLYAWFVTDASAMLASATDSLLDLFASIMNVIILRYALAPADEKHRFGHGKAESLAGLVQSAFVMGSAILLMINGIDRLISPKAIVHSEVGIGVTILAIILTLGLVSLQKYVIYKTQSVAIKADSLHYQSDLLLNAGVLASLLLSTNLWPSADGFFTLAVGAFLLWGAGKIAYLSVESLMDRELNDDEVQIIKQAVAEHTEAKGLHELRTRQSGPQRFIQFHLELDDNLTLYHAHRIGDEIESSIADKLAPCEVFIHHDPVSVIKDEFNKNEQPTV